MAKRKAKSKKLDFLWHEVFITFLAALIVSFGALFVQGGGFAWLVGVFTIWLGLLVFILPLVKKVEKLHS
jgi:hypothetical protein